MSVFWARRADKAISSNIHRSLGTVVRVTESYHKGSGGAWSPDSAHKVLVKYLFIADDRHILSLRLCNQHSVKWIFMQPR
jgi:hypothetical protein